LETYTLPVWSIRRLGGEIKQKLEYAADQIELKDAVKDPRLLVLKLAIGKAIDLLPDKPLPSQIEDIPETAGKILDFLDTQLFAQDQLIRAKNKAKEYVFLKLFGEADAGWVLVAPSFYGADP
jgi:hypothetical protein